MPFDIDKLKHFATGQEAAAFVADQVIQSCATSIAERGTFHWVLAGGSTPELCYRLLIDADMDWSKVHVWFGDERVLPKGDADRNETMARHALLDVVAIPDTNIHSIDFTNGTQTAASSYAQEIARIETFDLVMLGMGEDGHTASLFPNHDTLQSNELAVAEFDSPKPPPERISMGFKALNNHKQCFILATGVSKKDILQDIANGADLPVTHIENAMWMVDNAAWHI